MDSDTLDPKTIELVLPSFALLRHIPVSVLFAAFVVAVSVYLPRFRYKSQLEKFPLILEHLSGEQRRAKFLAGAKALYKDGHEKVVYWDARSNFTNASLVQRSSV